VGTVPAIIALGGVVLSKLCSVGVVSDRTEVTIVPSVLAGSVWRAYSCQSRHAWLDSTSPCFSQGSGWWRGHESSVCRMAKFDEGVMADPTQKVLIWLEGGE
jgi:hypothetical protein